MIFVPSGWHHTVENLRDTLSINHNWLNAHNIHWAASLLRSERAEAVAAIEDCRSPHPVLSSRWAHRDCGQLVWHRQTVS